MLWMDALAGSSAVAAWRGRKEDAEATHPAASKQFPVRGSWSGNPSNPTLPCAAHTPKTAWGNGQAERRQILFALHTRSSGR